MSKPENQLREEVESSQQIPGCVKVGTTDEFVTTYETFVGSAGLEIGSDGLEVGSDEIFVGTDDMYGVCIV